MFSNAIQNRNFYGVARRNPFNSRIRRRPIRNIMWAPPRPIRRATRNRSNNINSAKQSERQINFKVYAGSLTASGLSISCGPDTKMFANTSFCTTALNYNNYRPTKVSLEYTPLLNQTTAVSMINAYMTTDVKATIPKNDVDMKNSTVCHNGSEWFAANRVSKNFKIPVLKQNTYETGSGDIDGNSTYENAALIIVKPTSTDNSKLVFGELYLNITVAFSSPATPLLGTVKTINVGAGFAKDVAYAFSDYEEDFIDLLFTNKYAKFLSIDYHADLRAVNDWYVTLDSSTAFDNLPEFGKYFMFTDNEIKGDIYYEYVKGEDGDKWTPKASRSLNLVSLINRVVPSASEEVRVLFQNLLLEAETIPTHNKVTEDTDVTSVLVTEQPIDVNVNNAPLDVNVTNKSIDVNVLNDEIPVDILHQPIKTEVIESTGDKILNLLGTVLSFVRNSDDVDFKQKFSDKLNILVDSENSDSEDSRVGYICSNQNLSDLSEDEEL